MNTIKLISLLAVTSLMTSCVTPQQSAHTPYNYQTDPLYAPRTLPNRSQPAPAPSYQVRPTGGGYYDIVPK